MGAARTPYNAPMTPQPSPHLSHAPVSRLGLLAALGLAAALLTGCLADEADIPLDRPPTAAPATESETEPEESPTDETEPGESGLPAGAFAETECPFEVPDGAAVTCGYLVVPEDRTQPEGRQVELAVAILHSRSASPQPDPILYLSGGPGDSALADPVSWLENPLLDQRDFILLDQRGTGFSVPSLNCYELEIQADPSLTLESAQACRDRLAAEGIDLAQYNSAASAADVNDLRQALGIEEWNLLGISYGTRLALTVMRDYPEGVRSVVLDSVYPPNVHGYTEEAYNAAAAIQALLDGCAADPDCGAAFPDLAAVFYQLVDDLDQSPLELEEGDLFDGMTLVDVMVQALYDTNTIPDLPLAIYAAANGNFDRLLELSAPAEGSGRRARQQDDEDITDSEGAFYSVECHEEVPYADLDEAQALVGQFPPQMHGPLLRNVEELAAVCGFWGAGWPDAIEAQAVTSDIPTLILAGEYDPVTPPGWARLAAATLGRHYYFEVPRGGHALVDAGPCPLGLVIDFINRPLDQPDGGCLSGARLEFTLP